jgi:outer membrane protein TolC
VDLPIFDFGQRRAAVHESQELLFSQQALLKQLDLDLRAAITATYTQIYNIDEKLADLRAQYTQASNNALLARAERAQSLIDELTLVEAELALLSARASLVSEQQMKQIRYAELQNLAGGTWRWMQ